MASHHSSIAAVAALFASLAAATFAIDADLSWRTIDGGGGRSSGGAFELHGTIGQPDAGRVTGGAYELHGGFWPGPLVATLPPCPGDLNGDGSVDATDLAILLGSWGVCDACAADLDGDGVVGGPDLAILLGSWGC